MKSDNNNKIVFVVIFFLFISALFIAGIFDLITTKRSNDIIIIKQPTFYHTIEDLAIILCYAGGPVENTQITSIQLVDGADVLITCTDGRRYTVKRLHR